MKGMLLCSNHKLRRVGAFFGGVIGSIARRGGDPQTIRSITGNQRCNIHLIPVTRAYGSNRTHQIGQRGRRIVPCDGSFLPTIIADRIKISALAGGVDVIETQFCTGHVFPIQAGDIELDQNVFDRAVVDLQSGCRPGIGSGRATRNIGIIDR